MDGRQWMREAVWNHWKEKGRVMSKDRVVTYGGILYFLFCSSYSSNQITVQNFNFIQDFKNLKTSLRDT